MKRSTKDWVSYGSAIFMIVSGAALSFISFFMLHDVVSSVLIYLSEALAFAGGIYGIGMYIKAKFFEIETNLDDSIDRKIKQKL